MIIFLLCGCVVRMRAPTCACVFYNIRVRVYVCKDNEPKTNIETYLSQKDRDRWKMDSDYEICVGRNIT